MTADEVFILAREAFRKMAAQKGTSFRFTYDQIWDFLPPGTDVLSSQRPGAQRRLLRDGFLRKTGSMRNAATQARAGNLAPEYTFGTAIADTELPDLDSTEVQSIKGLKESMEKAVNIRDELDQRIAHVRKLIERSEKAK